jgi:cysteine-rich repeat protein
MIASMHVSLRRAAMFPSAFAKLAVAATLTTFVAPAPPAHAQQVPAAAFADCTKAILKQGGGLLKKRTDALIKCGDRLMACRLRDELDGEDFAACAAKVVRSCEVALSRLPKLEQKIVAKLGASCSPLRDHDLRTSVGLGMRRLEPGCGSVATKAEAFACTVSRIRCRAANLAEAVQPRLRENLDESGLLAQFPEATACLDVQAAFGPASGDSKDLLACQKDLAKTLSKAFVKVPKDASQCISTLLQCRLAGDRLLNTTQPPACYLDSKAIKACQKAHSKVSTNFGTGLLTKASEACAGIELDDLHASLGFEAVCPEAMTPIALVQCIRLSMGQATLHAVDDIAPRTCQLAAESPWALFNLGDWCAPQCGNGVVESGEDCDDGNRVDVDSCTNACEVGPTARESHSVPSPAKPSGTPDGTPANAVDPGSSIAIQFGTTMPDLNNASWVRYHAPGAGDADAVLVLVPGFAGGAHSLKIVAETMVAKAAAAGDFVLEVWAFDRRTDQLEDDAGAILGETEMDPALVMDWYFGDELGLALDPRLSRRGLFHEGQDIPFVANFTYNVFIRDIDAVVEVARALPGSPEVFLGGHSLGTLFSARYAATDLDPGVGVEPGYSKLAGLVLFEGGGDSLPIAAPSDDALDLVIAKADGGLYHAIATGSPSCWDGTPCPNGHADCAASPLASGALQNKCVSPVDAFAGGVISPQIHAVGDAVSMQARLHPDSLSIAQVDFGAGTAVDVVPGLSLLDLLPRGSAEATVGFFLDDDYSPEVSFQASVGFSRNGPHTDFGSFLLPRNANLDPYRLWNDFDTAMPPLAVPNNGAVTGAFDIHGQEKEATPMASLLTMVRTGDRNIGDWYFPSSGLGVTAELIVGVGGFTGGLDSSALSLGRGRPDIENLTEGAGIDIPVICFGGSNGISPTPGAFLPFAESIATCTAPGCDGATPRVVASDPVTPAYGNEAGGFEAYIAEGYAHIDVVSAEDDAAHNPVYDKLLDFLGRHTN